MCEELNRKEFHEAIDTTLSGLQADPWLAQRVVSRERTSEPVVKKKLSISLVLVIVLILITVTALAIEFILKWEKASTFMEKERTEGLYYHWEAPDRVAFVLSLIEEGLIDENSKTLDLQSEEIGVEKAASLADQILEEWIQCPKNQIGVLTVLENMWGKFEHWTLSQKAWFSTMLKDSGSLTPDMEVFMIPENNTITQAQAEQIAKSTIENWSGIAQGELADASIISEFILWPGYNEPVWYVEIYSSKLPNGSWYIEINPYSGEVDDKYRNTSTSTDTETGGKLQNTLVVATSQEDRTESYSKGTSNYEAIGVVEKYDNQDILLWKYEIGNPGMFVRVQKVLQLSEEKSVILFSSTNLKSTEQSNYYLHFLSTGNLYTEIPVYQNESWHYTPQLFTDGQLVALFRGASAKQAPWATEILFFDSSGTLLNRFEIGDIAFQIEGIVFLENSELIAHGRVLNSPESDDDTDCTGLVIQIDLDKHISRSHLIDNSRNVLQVSCVQNNLYATIIDTNNEEQIIRLSFDSGSSIE